MGIRRKLKSTARKAGGESGVPGPSRNPATNLLIMDIAIRSASLIAARGIEKAALQLRYHRSKAGQIVEGRSMVSTLAATGAARMATRSVPGFLLVTGGLLAKTLIDRSLRPRDARRRGDKQLAEQAEQAAGEE
ncbi:MAG TPA: hypothetical protein VFS49_06315 [Croceibacterium sp.]|nr:hypothetical protein [Croceibacterium sp.]